MSAPDRPTREQVAKSIADRIDWTPTYLADFGERAAIVEQVLRLAEHESAAEVRALRAELDRVHSALRHESDAHVAERHRLRAELTTAPTPEAYRAADHALNVWHHRRREALRLLRDWATADGLDTVKEWAEQIIGVLDAPVAPRQVPARDEPMRCPGCHNAWCPDCGRQWGAVGG